jgi:ABC-type transport system substrate-binding protein
MRSILRKIELALFALVALGCKATVAGPVGEDHDGPPKQGGILRAAFFVDVRTLDAALAFDSPSQAIESLIYDGLVSYDRDGKLIPVLAESIEVSPDGKRFTFPVRKGVLFHDGTELKAADVKRSIERLLHPKTPSPVSSYFERIVGYTAYHDGKVDDLAGVKLDGEYQISIELTERDATFLHILALPVTSVLCKSAGRVWDRNFTTSPCGAGPFKVVKFENGQIIKLTRHEGYWQKGQPYLDGVEWYLGMQAFTQRFKFEAGDLDFFADPSDADSLMYRTHPYWKHRGQWDISNSIYGSFMNTEMPPFDNRHVRRAIAAAVDRKQLELLRVGHVRAHGKMVPDSIIPNAPDYPHQRYDYDKALEEMRLAGYAYDPKTGQGGYPKEIPYLAIIDSFSQQAAEVHQQQLAKIGIKLRIQLIGWPTWNAKAGRRKTAHMGFAGWKADFPDPSTFFEPTLATKAIADEESGNWAFFSNKEFDGVLERARRSSDPAERMRLYRRAEEIISEEAPWLIAYETRFWEMCQPYMHAYRPHPVLSRYMRNVWIDREQQKPTSFRQASPRTTLALALGGRR